MMKNQSISTIGHTRRSYTELITLDSYEEKLAYCQCGSRIGIPTFGSQRYLNQALYANCPEWFIARDTVILRDNGCDLGDPNYPIPSNENIIVHHLNPITIEQVLNRDPCIFDPNNLISCRSSTHNFIHYSNRDPESRNPIERSPNDTSPWRKNVPG